MTMFKELLIFCQLAFDKQVESRNRIGYVGRMEVDRFNLDRSNLSARTMDEVRQKVRRGGTQEELSACILI